VPKYLFKVAYGPDSARGILKEGGTARRDFIRDLADQAGGKLESFYYAFGDTDAYVVMDLPDPETAAALSLTVSGTGALRTSITVLLTPEDMDAAGGKALPQYRPPGA